MQSQSGQRETRHLGGADLTTLAVWSIHLQTATHRGASRSDVAGLLIEAGVMKKRLLITGIVFAALLLALYGVVFGTGADWCFRSQSLSRPPYFRSWPSWARSAGWPSRPAHPSSTQIAFLRLQPPTFEILLQLVGIQRLADRAADALIEAHRKVEPEDDAMDWSDEVLSE
jgi:hypothetical protein